MRVPVPHTTSKQYLGNSSNIYEIPRQAAVSMAGPPLSGGAQLSAGGLQRFGGSQILSVGVSSQIL